MTNENRQRNARDELDGPRRAFSAGLEVMTHKSMVALLGQHFVRPGALSAATQCTRSPLVRWPPAGTPAA